MSLFKARSKPKTTIRRKTYDDEDGGGDEEVNAQLETNRDQDQSNADRIGVIKSGGDIQDTDTQQVNQSIINDNEHGDKIYKTTSKSTTTTTKKVSNAKASSTLSFDGDDDFDGNLPSFSVHNKSLKSGGMKRNTSVIASNTSSSASSFSTTSNYYQSSSGEYSKDALNKLKSQTSSRSQFHQPSSSMDIDDDENNNNNIMNIDEDDQDSTNTLPTLEQIKAAKEKRQRIRDHQNNSEVKDSFIPLNNNNRDKKYKEKVMASDKEVDFPSSDDEDAQYDEKQQRSNTISMIPEKKKPIGGKSKVDEEEKFIEMEEEDIEMKRWHLEQIKKGGGVSMDTTLTTQQRKHQQNLLESNTARQPVHNITRGGDDSFIDLVCKDIEYSLDTIEEVYQVHSSDLRKAEHSLEDSKLNKVSHESNQFITDDELNYYYEFQDYTSAMIDCLDEKIPKVEELETRLMDLEKDYSMSLFKQINDRINDQLNYLLSGNNQNNNNNNETVDEFGRDRNYYHNESRGKRMSLVKEKLDTDKLYHDMSNLDLQDDEMELFSDHQVSYYREEKQKVLELVRAVLEDVDDDYCKLTNIKEKFQHWKQKNYQSYKRIHLGLIIPTIFAPFIRLQLIDWNPLDNIKFDQFPWYNDLTNYGILNDIKLDQDDPDINLIPKLITKIIIPKVQDYITFIWNPFSRVQTKNLLNNLEEIQVYIEDSQELKTLYSSIFITIKNNIDSIILPISNHNIQEKEKDYVEYSYYLFKRSIKLLQTMYQWYYVLDIDNKYQLSNLCLDLLNTKILPFVGFYSKNWESTPNNIALQSMERITQQTGYITSNPKKEYTQSLFLGILNDLQSKLYTIEDKDKCKSLINKIEKL